MIKNKRAVKIDNFFVCGGQSKDFYGINLNKKYLVHFFWWTRMIKKFLKFQLNLISFYDFIE